MDTAITIDSNILEKVMNIVGEKNKRQIVEDALQHYILQKKQSKVRKYRGKLKWEGNLDEMRTAKW